MKVLHVEAGQSLFGGARQVLYLVRGLADRGVANVLVGADGAEVLTAVDPRTSVEPLSWKGELDISVIPRLLRLIRRHRPDLVHLHSRRGADTLGLAAARMAGVPVVITRRVDNPEPGWLARFKYRLADEVVAISGGIRQVLIDEGVPPDHVTLVHSSVEADAYAGPCDRRWLDAELGLSGGETLMAVVAQFIPRKGHGILLDVLPALLDAHPDLRVFFFGRGALEQELAARLQEPLLRGRVTLGGFRDDLHRVLPCLDLLVHPARMEGLGVALLQASAAGVPVVASRVGGIPEVIRDQVNGLLVPPGDGAALAAAIDGLLADPELRRRMGEAGRRLVREEFSVDAMVEGNLAVYRRVQARRGRD